MRRNIRHVAILNVCSRFGAAEIPKHRNRIVEVACHGKPTDLAVTRILRQQPRVRPEEERICHHNLRGVNQIQQVKVEVAVDDTGPAGVNRDPGQGFGRLGSYTPPVGGRLLRGAVPKGAQGGRVHGSVSIASCKGACVRAVVIGFVVREGRVRVPGFPEGKID